MLQGEFLQTGSVFPNWQHRTYNESWWTERFKKSSKSYEDWEMDSWISNNGDNWFLTKENTYGQSAFTLKDRVQSTIKVVKVERTLNISRTLKQMQYIVMT